MKTKKQVKNSEKLKIQSLIAKQPIISGLIQVSKIGFLSLKDETHT